VYLERIISQEEAVIAEGEREREREIDGEERWIKFQVFETCYSNTSSLSDSLVMMPIVSD
jgi:hypothetical protein